MTTLPYPTAEGREAAASADDAEAVFALVYRHMRALAATRGADLDDLVQVASEQALKSLPSFEGRAELSTWIYRVCYLTLLKHDRSLRRWLRRFLFTTDGELPEVAIADPAADEALAAGERAKRLRVALATLSPKRRAVVVLHDLERVPADEIAAIVGAKIGTVRSRLRDGRKDLARALRDDPYFGEEVKG